MGKKNKHSHSKEITQEESITGNEEKTTLDHNAECESIGSPLAAPIDEDSPLSNLRFENIEHLSEKIVSDKTEENDQPLPLSLSKSNEIKEVVQEEKFVESLPYVSEFEFSKDAKSAVQRPEEIINNTQEELLEEKSAAEDVPEAAKVVVQVISPEENKEIISQAIAKVSVAEELDVIVKELHLKSDNEKAELVQQFEAEKRLLETNLNAERETNQKKNKELSEKLLELEKEKQEESGKLLQASKELVYLKEQIKKLQGEIQSDNTVSEEREKKLVTQEKAQEDKALELKKKEAELEEKEKKATESSQAAEREALLAKESVRLTENRASKEVELITAERDLYRSQIEERQNLINTQKAAHEAETTSLYTKLSEAESKLKSLQENESGALEKANRLEKEQSEWLIEQNEMNKRIQDLEMELGQQVTQKEILKVTFDKELENMHREKRYMIEELQTTYEKRISEKGDSAKKQQQKLIQENQTLNEQISALQLELLQKKDANNYLQNEILMYKRDSINYENTLQKTHQILVQVEKEYEETSKALIQERHGHNMQNLRYDEEIASLQRRSADLIQEIELLQESHEHALQKQRKQISDLASDNKAKQDTIFGLLDEKNSQKLDKNNRYDSLVAENSNLTSRIQSIEKSYSAEVAVLRREIDSVTRGAQEEKLYHQELLDRLHQELDNKKQQIINLQIDQKNNHFPSHLQQQLDIATREKNQQVVENLDLKAEVDALQDTVRDLEHEKIRLQLALKELKNSKDAQNAAHASLAERYQKLQHEYERDENRFECARKKFEEQLVEKNKQYHNEMFLLEKKLQQQGHSLKCRFSEAANDVTYVIKRHQSNYQYLSSYAQQLVSLIHDGSAQSSTLQYKMKHYAGQIQSSMDELKKDIQAMQKLTHEFE